MQLHCDATSKDRSVQLHTITNFVWFPFNLLLIRPFLNLLRASGPPHFLIGPPEATIFRSQLAGSTAGMVNWRLGFVGVGLG